jgi:hypothetical protein
MCIDSAVAQPISAPSQESVARFARPVHQEGAPAPSAEPESWPGPWSTAREMISQRESARKSREAVVASRGADTIQDDTGQDPEDVSDDYTELLMQSAAERLLPTFRPALNAARMIFSVPSLSSIAAKVVAAHIDMHNHLDGISLEWLGNISVELSTRRQLNSQALNLIIPANCSSINIPECSMIDEKSLIDRLNRAAVDEGCSLEVINLHNCGSCFTDAASTALRPMLNTLQVLSIRGSFKLSEQALSSLLVESSALRVVDISYNLRVGSLCTNALSKLSGLRELAMDGITHLSDADILRLCSPELQKLSSLSLCNASLLTDKSIIAVTTNCGRNLTKLNIEGCSLLTDVVIASLCENNPFLHSLNISSLPLLGQNSLLQLFHRSDDATVRRVEFQDVKLNKLSAVDDNVIIALCSSSGNALKSLSIASCGKVSGHGLMALAVHCTSALEYLNISFVRALPEHAVFTVLKRCEKLKEVEAWGCTQLSQDFKRVCTIRAVEVVGIFA